jgi:hypothetical protein
VEAVHEPLLWTVGALACGAVLITALPPKDVTEFAALVEAAALDVRVVAVLCVAGCASRTATPKAAKALTATALIE